MIFFLLKMWKDILWTSNYLSADIGNNNFLIDVKTSSLRVNEMFELMLD